ncbi:MAG: hypothetical protein OEL88_02055 [Sterolibacteriaceae bacterium MAG5]|nr:hypothetical protein [Candidatus Nitricoxidireducens bremensis]
MREFAKYLVELSCDELSVPSYASGLKDYNYFANEYGYSDPSGYDSVRSFVERYFVGYQLGRLEYYLPILKSAIPQNSKILSLASGRPVVEALMSELGYDVTCSDLEVFREFEKVKNLFPHLEYRKLDVVVDEIPAGYTTILALGLLYLFDEATLRQFFRKVAEGVAHGGLVVVDSAISPDTMTSYLIHDILLRSEAHLKKVYYQLQGQKAAVRKVSYGFRKRHSEIIQIANEVGLAHFKTFSTGVSIELNRSYILRTLMRTIPGMSSLLKLMAHDAPFVNVYAFRKL